MSSLDLPQEMLMSPQGGDRSETLVSREKRHMTILLVARLLLENGEDQLCRIRNLSSGGLMLDTSVVLKPAQRISIQLRDLCALQGSVVWVRPPRAGIQFDSQADVADLLHSITGKVASAGVYVPRSPRMSTECPVRVHSSGRITAARLLDLSQRGARLQGPGRSAGEQITLKIPGLEPQQAVVRWARDEEAGVVFFETVSYGQLDSWLQDHSVRYAARST